MIHPQIRIKYILVGVSIPVFFKTEPLMGQKAYLGQAAHKAGRAAMAAVELGSAAHFLV